MLRSRFIIICAFFLFPIFTFGQVSNSHNLVRNSGFENGGSPPNNQCDGSDYDFGDVVNNWQEAIIPRSSSENTCGTQWADPQIFTRGNNNCSDELIDAEANHFTEVDGIFGNCATQSIYDKFFDFSGNPLNVGNRVAFLRSTFVACPAGFNQCRFHLNHPTIITDLRNNLDENTRYILRIQAMPLRGERTTDIDRDLCSSSSHQYGDNILQVYFSENGKEDWFREPSNPLYDNDLCKNPNSLVNPGTCGEWQYFTLEFNISGDCENDEVGNVDDLRFLVLSVKEGAFLINNVELYEKCPNNSVTVENITYDSYFYNTNNFRNPQGSPYITYSSNEVQTLSGSSVIVEDEAVVNYWSGTKITLNPGFKAQVGASFHAEIRNCNPTSWIVTNSNENSHNSSVSINEKMNKNGESKNGKNNKVKNRSKIIYKKRSGHHHFIYLSKPNKNKIKNRRKLKGGITKVFVYNSRGKRISQQDFPTPRKGVDVSLNGVSSGVYLIKVVGNNVNYTKKLLID